MARALLYVFVAVIRTSDCQRNALLLVRNTHTHIHLAYKKKIFNPTLCQSVTSKHSLKLESCISVLGFSIRTIDLIFNSLQLFYLFYFVLLSVVCFLVFIFCVSVYVPWNASIRIHSTQSTLSKAFVQFRLSGACTSILEVTQFNFLSRWAKCQCKNGTEKKNWI